MDRKTFEGFQEARVCIVTGPPGAGKTTYAKQNRRPGDIIVDLDYIAAALMLSEKIPNDYTEVLSTAVLIREMVIDAIARNALTFGRAFIITTENARKIQNRTGGQIITIDPGIEETMRRIEADTCSPERKRKRQDLALKYYYKKDRKKV